MRSLLCLILLSALLPAQPSVQVAGALAAGSYFPLEVGDRWVYRVDSRGGTAGYETWRIDRTEDIAGKQYSVVTIIRAAGVAGESRFRADDQGRIFLLTGAGDQLFLDARPAADPGMLKAGAGGPYVSSLGSFADTLKYTNQLDSLDLETGVLGRGIGLLTSTQVLETGSSGGFTSGRTLVEAAVGGGAIRFTAGAAGLHVGMESLTLDVSGRQVTNCILPCYFAACGFAGPVPDPPGTYKPCARARVSLENWPADASRSVRLRLLAPDNTTLYDQPFTLVSAPGEVALTTQIPLYSAPNQPYPPGSYQLTAATDDGSAQSAVTVQIK